MTSLLFNMLSRFIIALLPRSKSLNFRAAVTITVILEPKKIKSVIGSIFFPIYLPFIDKSVCHDLSFLTLEFLSSLFTLPFHFHQEAL